MFHFFRKKRFIKNKLNELEKHLSVLNAQLSDLSKSVSSDCYGVNIGGGDWFCPGWENVDFYINSDNVDYKINLLKCQNLPIKSSSRKYVFCSHLIEHLSDEQDLALLSEVYRILDDRGVLRISCPDADKAIEAYKEGNQDFFFKNTEVTLTGDTIERRLVNYFASFRCSEYMGIKNYSGGPIVDDAIIKQKFDDLSKDEFIIWCREQIPEQAEYRAHINGFYFDKLSNILKKIGFREVYKSDFRCSFIKDMRKENFDNRPLQSLYVEAVK